ncbi:MAG: N-acetylglucosamine-6-phosphate deacetylase [Acidimicrobiales bacterium]
MSIFISGAKVVSPSGVLDPGWIRVSGGLIDGIGDSDLGPARLGEDTIDLHRSWVLPGLVDIHCHGGGGHSFASHDPAEVASAATFHRDRGSTKLLASLVSAPPDDLVRSLDILADLASDGQIAGVHLEGPFLAETRCGAQNPGTLLSPDHAIMDRLLEAGRGAVRMVTIAPELPGAIDLIRQVASRGIIPAIGHTDATYLQTMAAIDAGARVATHLFNGMRPIHHREPGPVLAALERPEMCCELIPDGIHLHPATVRLVLAAAGTARVALVSDAIAGAGMPDGDYILGGQAVQVRSGVSRLAGGGSIAGSTITASAGLQWAVKKAGLAIEDVAHMASEVPAGLVGLGNRCGKLEVGSEADMVVCDTDFTVTAVMVAGRWISGPAV